MPRDSCTCPFFHNPRLVGLEWIGFLNPESSISLRASAATSNIISSSSMSALSPVCHRLIGTYTVTIRCRSHFFVSTCFFFILRNSSSESYRHSEISVSGLSWPAPALCGDSVGVTGLGVSDLARIPPMVDETWRNDWLKLKSVEHNIKTLADARLKQRDHSAEPAQDVGRLAKRALFKSVRNCCCTSPVTRSVASVPCQRSGRTFLDYKVGTRPEPCGFHVRKESCSRGNFLVNLGNFLYLLYFAKYAAFQQDFT